MSLDFKCAITCIVDSYLNLLSVQDSLIPHYGDIKPCDFSCLGPVTLTTEVPTDKMISVFALLLLIHLHFDDELKVFEVFSFAHAEERESSLK